MLYKILDFLEDGTRDIGIFAAATIIAGYGASSAKIESEYRKLDAGKEKRIINRQETRDLRKYLSKLKSQGLIVENILGKVSISKKGKKKLRTHKILDSKFYKPRPSNKIIIISYDIPTPFNRERDILRGILKSLGFRMIHRSVWVGKVGLPRQFITALRTLRILKFVEVLEVTKSGSLKELN